MEQSEIGETGYVSSEYAYYLIKHEVTQVNETVVEDLLEQSKEVTILLQVENNDNLQEKINQIQDAASAAEKKLENVDISVQVMADISPLSEYREQPNYYYFDYYHIDGIDYNDRIAYLE